MLTVAELAAEVLPAETAVVAGEAGLGREVAWATRPRPSPPAFDHLTGGEVVLLAVSRLTDADDRMTLERAVRLLADFGVAAVAVTGRISAAARASADGLGLPLLQLPASADLGIVERKVAEAIGARRKDTQRLGHETGRRLMELAIAGESLSGLLEATASEARRIVALESREGRLLALVGPDEPTGRHATGREELARALRDGRPSLEGWLVVAAAASPAEPPTNRSALGPGLERTVAPVIGRDGLLGTLSLVSTGGAAGTDDGPLASRAAAACSIVLGREHSAQAARRELELNVLDEILDGALRNEVTLLQQAARLGHDLTLPHAVLLVRLETGADIGPAAAEALARRGLRPLWRSRGPAAELVLDPAEAAAASETIVADLRRTAGADAVSAGLGSPQAGLDGVQRSRREAERALTIGVRRDGPGRVTRFADLGIHRLLFAAADLPELAALRDEALGGLLAYDARHGAALVATLHAFLDANGGPKEAAAALGVHRNTVLYRLDRIREVTGVDLDDAETRLRLHLAVTIQQALPAPAPTP